MNISSWGKASTPLPLPTTSVRSSKASFTVVNPLPPRSGMPTSCSMPTNLIPKLPSLSGVTRCPCSTSAKRLSRRDLTRRCTGSSATNPQPPGNWTAPAKPVSSRSPAANRRKVDPAGRCSYLPIASWNWRSSTPSRSRPSNGR